MIKYITYASEVAEHIIKNKHEKNDMNLEFLGFETKLNT